MLAEWFYKYTKLVVLTNEVVIYLKPTDYIVWLKLQVITKYTFSGSSLSTSHNAYLACKVKQNWHKVSISLWIEWKEKEKWKKL